MQPGNRRLAWLSTVLGEMENTGVADFVPDVDFPDQRAQPGAEDDARFGLEGLGAGFDVGSGFLEVLEH
jgi:hypothetical protein